MNYKDAFAIDDTFYKDRQKDNSYELPLFQLKNFDYFEPKLVQDFYLKYFTKEALFEVHILDLKDFLLYHYDYCESPEKYFDILEYEILPKIAEIITNAKFSLEGQGYYNEIKLDNGFVETEGVIKNYNYEYGFMYHITTARNLQHDLEKRSEIIQKYLTEYRNNQVTAPLKWIAGPSQLGIIIRELVEKGYIEPEYIRGEINSSKLARDVFRAFSIKDSESKKSLEIYLSPNNKKYQAAKNSLIGSGFCIPNSKFS